MYVTQFRSTFRHLGQFRSARAEIVHGAFQFCRLYILQFMNLYLSVQFQVDAS
jgi:hypothetical protein